MKKTTMRLYPLGEVEDGMILGKSIYQANGKLLLGAGFRIGKDIKYRLLEKGYSYIYIMEKGTGEAIPEDIISEEVRLQAQTRLADKVDEIKRLANFQDLTYSKALNLLESGYFQKVSINYEMRQIVKDILRDISVTGAKFYQTLMVKSKDSFFFDHSLNTTVIAVLIGARYRFSKAELFNLALGTFLHDIGKIIIDQVDHDPSKTGRSLYREHPTFGYLLLKNSPDVTPMEVQVVNQHHEYQDGSGFPIGLKGDNIPPTKSTQRITKGHIFRLAEICCVADAYDKMVLNPFEEVRVTPEGALKQLIIDAGKLYNKSVVETLHEIIPIFPVGSTIQIEEIVDPTLYGYFGVVAKINESKLNRPIIILTMNKLRKKVKPIMIDTSKLHSVKLKLII
jgi:HD-GYP domain-containing protein (c-di-GMP phosphodiesterase class II)